MILVSLIKKELIYFFRNKSNVATMFIFPIVLIVVMGFSLNGVMSNDKNIFENEKVYFKINDLNKENKYINVFNSFKENCEKNMKIKFEEVTDKNFGINNVNNFNGLAFINIYKDKYDFYRNENKESLSQKIFRNVFNQYLERYSVIEGISRGVSNNTNDIFNEISYVTINEEGISSNGITSFTYYTFAELALIILYISQVTSISVFNEKCEKTLERLKLSQAKASSIILSKVALGIVIGIIQIIIVYIVSTVFLNISWGENLYLIIMVLISLVIFSSILGVAISSIFVDNKSALSILNIILIIFGFLGGSYVPISLIRSRPVTNFLCKIVPNYWTNISLLSLSSGIKSNYPTISIIMSLELSLVLLIICFIKINFRAGDNNA